MESGLSMPVLINMKLLNLVSLPLFFVVGFFS